MDSADDPIGFDQHGVCSFCRGYDEAATASASLRAPGALDGLVREIKSHGAGRDYDCVVGVSGGVDSSYVAYLAVQSGLRPLAVHLDNGWNSELAVNNIHEVVRRLGIELHTHVVDWPEFRALQLAYLRAGVVDTEVVSDHAINALAYRVALEERIKYILAGNNIATEYVMPPTWNYRKQDLRNLKAIARRHGGPTPKTFPTGSTLQFAWWELARGITKVHLLDYVEYDKSSAIATLQALGWRPYPGKHYESLFTQFYQAHILPTKYGIDKRRAHLASLVTSGQLSRASALEQLGEPIYHPDELRRHKTYVLKKLGLAEEEFERILSEPPRRHDDYPHDGWYAFYVMKLMRILLAPLAAARRWKRARTRRALSNQPSEARSASSK